MSARVRLAGRLIEARVQAGFSQRALSECVLMDPSVLSRIENAMRIPSHEQMRTLMRTLVEAGVKLNEDELVEIYEAAQEERTQDAGASHLTSVNSIVELAPSGTTAFRASRGGGGGGIGEREPDPTPVSTVAELTEALNEVHIWAGAPSLRKIEKTMDRGNNRLSKSTISEMLRRPKLPPLGHCLAFLEACGIRNVDPWRYTWRRLKMLERRGEIGA